MAKRQHGPDASAIKVVAHPAVQSGCALLVAGPLVVHGAPEALLAMFEDAAGSIRVDRAKATISFDDLEEAALGMAVAVAAKQITDTEAKELLTKAARALAEANRAAKLTNIGKENEHGKGKG